MSRCSSCGNEIEWAVTERNGRRIPLDPGCTAAGNLLPVETTANSVLVVRKIETNSDPAARVAHFATCPRPVRRSKGAKA